VLTESERAVVTDWLRLEYGDPTASIIGFASRTTGFALRIQLRSTIMWLRAGGVVRRSLEDTERDGLAANELRATGVALAAPVPKADGTLAGLLRLGEGNLPSIGYVELDGTEVHTPSMKQAEALGVTLRKLHAANLRGPAKALPTVEPLTNIQQRLSEVAKWVTADQLRDLTKLVEHAERQTRGAASLSSICHGDIRYANVRFEGERPTLFDLEALGQGPAQYDLACMWRRRLIEAGFQGVPDDWNWLRRGYESQGPMGFEDWSLVPALACLRAFWTMSLPVEPGAAWGDTFRASPAYWQAHVDQIRWFGHVMLCSEGTV
jgi:Ser/Thr protein kinase RdoA (MazF antagonist)